MRLAESEAECGPMLPMSLFRVSVRRRNGCVSSNLRYRRFSAIGRRFLRRRLRVLNGYRGHQPLDSVLNELHDDGLAVGLLHAAGAVAEGDGAGGALAALAGGAFPEAAEVVFQAFVGTLH